MAQLQIQWRGPSKVRIVEAVRDLARLFGALGLWGGTLRSVPWRVSLLVLVCLFVKVTACGLVFFDHASAANGQRSFRNSRSMKWAPPQHLFLKRCPWERVGWARRPNGIGATVCRAQCRVAEQGSVEPAHTEFRNMLQQFKLDCPGKLKREEAQFRGSRISDGDFKEDRARGAVQVCRTFTTMMTNLASEGARSLTLQSA